MPNLIENSGASFDPVRRIERNDPVLGGAPEIANVVNSPYNYLAQALVNRDIYLKEAIETLAATIPDPVVDATTTISGKVRLATLSEMREGTHETAVATAEGVQEAIDQIPIPDVTVPDATTAQKGKVELATRAEGRNRSRSDVVITPDSLDAALDGLPNSSESQKGFIERTTQTEAETGTDNSRALTALRSMQQLRHSNAQATTSRRGTVRRATQSEVNSGTNTEEYVTPETLIGYIKGKTDTSGMTLSGGFTAGVQRISLSNINYSRLLLSGELFIVSAITADINLYSSTLSNPYETAELQMPENVTEVISFEFDTELPSSYTFEITRLNNGNLQFSGRMPLNAGTISRKLTITVR